MALSKKSLNKILVGRTIYGVTKGEYTDLALMLGSDLTIDIQLGYQAEEAIRTFLKQGLLADKKELDFNNYLHSLGVKNWFVDKRKDGYRIKVTRIADNARASDIIGEINDLVLEDDITISAGWEKYRIDFFSRAYDRSKNVAKVQYGHRLIIRTSIKPSEIIIHK